MPAPAVIPAPIAYIKVVVVKTLVVDVLALQAWSAGRLAPASGAILLERSWLSLTEWPWAPDRLL